MTAPVNERALSDQHLPRPSVAGPGGTGAAEGAAAEGEDAPSIRVVVVGTPGPQVETLLALLAQVLSVEVVGTFGPVGPIGPVGREAPEVVGTRMDVAVVDLSEDGGPEPGAAPCCTCSADVRTTRVPRPGPHPAEAGAAVRVVTCPNRAQRPRVLEGVEASSARWECSPREREVLAVLAEGATNPEIAARLSISEATVRSHVQNLRGKLQARSRAELVVRGFEMGLGPFAWAY